MLFLLDLLFESLELCLGVFGGYGDDHAAFPVTAVQLGLFGLSIFDEAAPGAFGEIGAADVGPAFADCSVLEDYGFAWRDVEDLGLC